MSLKTYNFPSKRLRLGIVQRLLTPYRSPFFKKLTTKNDEFDITVFFGEPMNNETIKVLKNPQDFNYYSAKNRYLLNSPNMLLVQTNIIEWLNKFDPDVIVMEANPRILSHWQAIRWMHNRNRPVLGWGLGELEREGSSISQSLRRLIANKLVTSFDGMIAYSNKAKDDYIRYGSLPDHIYVAHNSIDNSESEAYLNQFCGCEWLESWYKQNNFNSKLLTVIFVGRLIASKEIELLIRACIPLFDQCQLLIVGDGPHLPKLQQLSADYEQSIHFAGYQTGEMLAKSFIAADLFVLPAAGGLALHQAMSYGKPAIASFGDGTEADLIRNGHNGFIFEKGNINQLSEKIRQILTNPHLLQSMSDNSLAIIRQEINLDRMASSFLTAVRDTVGRFSTTTTY